MASRHPIGAIQPDGTVVPEPTFDVKHVANTIVHIASLPPDVAMLEVNIMYEIKPAISFGILSHIYAIGQPERHTSAEAEVQNTLDRRKKHTITPSQ